LLSFHNAVSPNYVGHPSSAMSLGHSVAILVDAFWYDDQRNAALVKEPVALVYYLNAVGTLQTFQLRHFEQIIELTAFYSDYRIEQWCTGKVPSTGW
jgi:hypothetical protein